MNCHKIAFIICINEGQEFAECSYYLERIIVPEGYEKDVITIQEAPSMAAGYNAGMQSSDAKYKIYLHQDVFIINQNFIIDMLEIFADDGKIGLLGCIGATRLDDSARAIVDWDVGKVLHNCTPTRLEFADAGAEYTKVEAVDGFLIATQYDIPWREDLFDGFDYYDISQCMEMRRAGYCCVVPRQRGIWCYHDNSYSKMMRYYEYNRRFVEEYQDIKEFQFMPPSKETVLLAEAKEETRDSLMMMLDMGKRRQFCEIFMKEENRGFLHLREFEIIADVELLESEHGAPEHLRLWQMEDGASAVLARMRRLKHLMHRMEFVEEEAGIWGKQIFDSYTRDAIEQIRKTYIEREKES